MKYLIQNESLRVEVESLGAELSSVQIEGMEYLWQGDKNVWPRKAPNLFPYVGRLKDNEYWYQGEKYSMEIHGFAKEQEFVCEKIREDYLLCYLEDNEETYATYPFSFRYEVHYELVGNVVRICYVVKNKDECPLRFVVGGHPGFRVPLKDDERFEDYYVQFEENTMPIIEECNNEDLVEFEIHDSVAGERCRIPLSHRMFDEDSIFFADRGGKVQLCNKEGIVLEVRYPQMQYVGLWQWPKKNAPYVCIEPWVALPYKNRDVSDWEEKPDLITIDIEDIYSNQWEIEIVQK